MTSKQSPKVIEFEEEEKLGGIYHYMGEPSFIVGDVKFWALDDNKGFLYAGSILYPFVVSLEDQIFDVWYEGHFVDHGEMFYNAYISYIVERDLLK